MIKAIIFDFDGVITESLKVKADAFAEIYNSYGKVVVNKVVKHHHANGGMSRSEKFKYYHEKFLDEIITNNEIKRLSNIFSKQVVKKVIKSSYVPGVFEFINENYTKYKMFISTATPENEIKKIIRGRNIRKYFTDIFGAPEKKSEHIKEIIDKYHFNNEEIIFIGDAIADMNAAIEYDISFILRIHKYNKNQFKDYKGNTVCDFNNLKMFLKK